MKTSQKVFWYLRTCVCYTEGTHHASLLQAVISIITSVCICHKKCVCNMSCPHLLPSQNVCSARVVGGRLLFLPGHIHLGYPPSSAMCRGGWLDTQATHPMPLSSPGEDGSYTWPLPVSLRARNAPASCTSDAALKADIQNGVLRWSPSPKYCLGGL